jgi:uncharacterized protein (UPF0216 family)
VDVSSDTLKKWMKLEAKGLNDRLVIKRKNLERLIEEDEPVCSTRDKNRHEFDKMVLQKLADTVPEAKHSQLMLPVNVFVDLNVKNQCYVEDELGAETIRSLEDFGRAFQFRDGRMWLPLSLAVELVGRYRTAVQMVYLV